MIEKLILLLILYSGFNLHVFAETIVLKSGKKVEGKITEKADRYIKIDFDGVPLTYYIDEVNAIDGVVPTALDNYFTTEEDMSKKGSKKILEKVSSSLVRIEDEEQPL